jgi:hypothetical protein
MRDQPLRRWIGSQGKKSGESAKNYAAFLKKMSKLSKDNQNDH